jgi:hypothetical protein
MRVPAAGVKHFGQHGRFHRYAVHLTALHQLSQVTAADEIAAGMVEPDRLLLFLRFAYHVR